jgi:hypothetical protein
MGILCTEYITFCCIKVTIPVFSFPGFLQTTPAPWTIKKLLVGSESFNVLPGSKKIRNTNHGELFNGITNPVSIAGSTRMMIIPVARPARSQKKS